MDKDSSGESASAVARWIADPRLADDRRRYFGPLMDINRAHALMLFEQGLLVAHDARVLLQAIDVVSQDPTRAQPRLPMQDLYYAVESSIIAEAGERIGGNLHIGRSRNDITATMTRLVLRDTGSDLTAALLEFLGSLLELAAAHINTIMPGYTHLRPGQPTTLGHYLTGLVSALRRDWSRLSQALERADECPMGAAAFAGTRFALNRTRVAELLGFKRPVSHTLDAVASRDYVLEMLACLSILATTVSRFVQDLYIWSTIEFGFVVLSPAITGGSSVMPQKRNPDVLERCRAKAAHVAAAAIEAIIASKGTGFMHCQDISIDSVSPLWIAATETRAMLAVTNEVVRTLTVDVARLRDRSTAGFTLATEIADALVRLRRLPFRTAHRVVSQVMGREQRDDIGSGLATRLNAAAAELLGHGLDITEEEVLEWTDPVASVNEKRDSGAPAPQSVRAMLAELTTWHQQARNAHHNRITEVERTRTALHRATVQGSA